MKNKYFLLATLAAVMATASSAQTVIGEVPFSTLIIPQEFSSDGQVKMMELVENSQVKIYNHNLQVEHQMQVATSNSDGYFIQYVYYYSFSMMDYAGISVTQNLFNDDAQYEYVRYNENDDGITIMSENGTAIWAWHPQASHVGDAMIVEWDGVYYIVTEEYDYDNPSAINYTWYRIDRPSQSITRVEGDMPLNVFPSVADRSQIITVELGEGNNATEVQVVNSLGQVVKSVPVQPGQREVQLRASDLGGGMHIVGTRSRDGQGACKIIVK